MLLAIDTSTQMLSIALHDGDALFAECTLRAGRQHSALLAPLIDDTMMQTGVCSKDLTALAVSVGPGSYTGVRIGVALAKGMAAPRNLPLVPVTTLETVVAAQARHRDNLPLVATVSARATAGHLGRIPLRRRCLARAARAANQRLGGDSVTL